MPTLPGGEIEAPSGGDDSKRLPPFHFVAAIAARSILWTCSDYKNWNNVFTNWNSGPVMRQEIADQRGQQDHKENRGSAGRWESAATPVPRATQGHVANRGRWDRWYLRNTSGLCSLHCSLTTAC